MEKTTYTVGCRSSGQFFTVSDVISCRPDILASRTLLEINTTFKLYMYIQQESKQFYMRLTLCTLLGKNRLLNHSFYQQMGFK